MWTLIAAGMDPTGFLQTEAAMVHNVYSDPENFPKMIWSTNYYRLACQTMFTLFFAGRDFAPKAVIDGINIQDYLQNHFIDAVCFLAEQVSKSGDLLDCCIIGWESLNEPNAGLISNQDLAVLPKDQKLRLGTSPTAFQAMLLGSGYATEVETWTFGRFGPYKNGSRVVDPAGKSAWLAKDYDDSRYGWKRSAEWKLGMCLWAWHGVWRTGSQELLKPHYFAKLSSGAKVNTEYFTNEYFVQHFKKYTARMRTLHLDAILFCQPPVLVVPPRLKGTSNVDDRMVYSPHFYDGMTLMTKRWNTVFNVDVLGILRGRYSSVIFALAFGEHNIRDCLKEQLVQIRKEGLENMGDIPCLMSEIGIPFDMDDSAAYKTHNYTSQIRAMDANHYALEGANLNYCLWCYCSIVQEWRCAMLTLEFSQMGRRMEWRRS